MRQLCAFDDIGKIYIDGLTQSYVKDNCGEIIRLINDIPFVDWNEEQLLSQSEDYYRNKWNYSYVILDEKLYIVGVLIAYFRISDSKHIFDSLYLHRLVIRKGYRNRGIGTSVLRFFVDKSFKEIPWLLNISAQTNYSMDNAKVIHFYEKSGFVQMYNVVYTNKVDILLLIERRNYHIQIDSMDYSSIRLKHPRLSMKSQNGDGGDSLPMVYFASTNPKKKEMVRFILNNYNIEVSFVKPPVELIEPQIEGPELREEIKLVSVPLKTVARFINKTPYVVEDTMLFIEFFNRNYTKWELPGLDTKRWLRQIGSSGILDIMGNSDKRKAKFVSQAGAYLKPNVYCFGRGELFGRISDYIAEVSTPKYGTYPYFFHVFFIPDGADKTLAEMDMYEYAQYDYMRKGIVNMIQDISNSGIDLQQYTLFDYYGDGII